MGSSNRPRSSHLADIKGKGIFYEDDDAPIILSEQDDMLIASEFSLSLIGKVLNLNKQNVDKLLQMMPSQWGMEDRITANDLGIGSFFSISLRKRISNLFFDRVLFTLTFVCLCWCDGSPLFTMITRGLSLLRFK